jgi:hypothetical protein
MSFINRSGRAISNRGLEAVTTIEKADGVIDKAKVGNKILTIAPDLLMKANTFTLKWLLSKPDVLAARTAWLAYYKKSMKEQGLEVDYSGEVNDKAADYAQAMIDRNMYVSDTELRGKFFRDKKAYKVFMKQVFFPFATFALNQKNRMWNDMSVLVSKTSSTQDKVTASRSMAALTAEVIVYNGIRYAIGKLILEAAMESLGLSDEEKEEIKDKYEQNIKKSVLGKAVQDLMSPSPILDGYTLKVANGLMDWSGINESDEGDFDKMIQEEQDRRMENYEELLTPVEIEKKRLKFHKDEDFQFFIDDEKSFGTFGIQYEKAKEAYELFEAWRTGVYVQESKYGDTEKYLTEEGREKLFLPMLLKTGGATFLPRESDQLANRMYSIVKNKYGLTDSQSSKVSELESLGYKPDDTMLKIVKAPKGVPKTVDGIVETLDYINSLSESDKKAYFKELGI